MTIERLTTGDFIGFSCLDAVRVEPAAQPRPLCPDELAVGLRYTVGNSRFGSAFLCELALCPFPGGSEIDDLSHAQPHCSQTKELDTPLPDGALTSLIT
jgi:hypothetical protein